jgi:hypothetical protein
MKANCLAVIFHNLFYKFINNILQKLRGREIFLPLETRCIVSGVIHLEIFFTKITLTSFLVRVGWGDFIFWDGDVVFVHIIHQILGRLYILYRFIAPPFPLFIFGRFPHPSLVELPKGSLFVNINLLDLHFLTSLFCLLNSRNPYLSMRGGLSGRRQDTDNIWTNICI